MCTNCRKNKSASQIAVLSDTNNIQTRVIEAEGEFLCKNTAKYKKLLTQEYINGEWTTVSESYGDIIETNSTDCGCVDGKLKKYKNYRTTPNSTTCIGFNKYEKLNYEGSDDNVSWNKIRTILGNLIQHNSTECGYTPMEYKWDCEQDGIDFDNGEWEVILEEIYDDFDEDTFEKPNMYTYYQTKESDSNHICIGYEQYSTLLFQGSDDNKTWVTIDRIPNKLLAINSPLCGWPPSLISYLGPEEDYLQVECTQPISVYNDKGNVVTLNNNEKLHYDIEIWRNNTFVNSNGLDPIQEIIKILHTPNTKNLTSMKSMFKNHINTTSINLSNFDTSNITNMYEMFYGCQKLTSLDLNTFNTNKVKNMGFMFWGCESLNALDISNFDTSNVTNMNFMFCSCSLFTSLDVNNFNTSNVTDMEAMFSDCSKLISLDLSNFDTSKVTNMKGMFNNCSSFTSLDLSNFDTSNVTTMNNIFSDCTKLTSLDLSNFDTSKVEDMGLMFTNCESIISLDLSSFNTNNVNDMEWMFQSCKKLVELNLSNWELNSSVNLSGMFDTCPSLKTIIMCNCSQETIDKINSIKPEQAIIYSDNIPTGNKRLSSVIETITTDENKLKVKYYEEEITKCDGSVDWIKSEEYETISIETTTYHFIAKNSTSSFSYYANGFVSDSDSQLNSKKITVSTEPDIEKEVYIENFDEITSCYSMFYNCQSLTLLDLSNFDTSNIIDMGWMFQSCKNLASLNLSSFNTSKVTSMSSMFRGCQKLASLDLSNFDTSNVTDMSWMFNVCNSITSLDLSNFDTSKVTDMSCMFYSCANKSFTSLDLSNFDTRKVENMSYMFNSCLWLKNLDLSNWVINEATNVDNMLFGCNSLEKIYMRNCSNETIDKIVSALISGWVYDAEIITS